MSPVPEPKPKSQPIPVVDAKSESKSGQNSPAEREILVPDMSKSMSDMKLSPMEVKPIPKPYRAPPVDADKAPLIKSKPVVPSLPSINRHSLGKMHLCVLNGLVYYATNI